MTDFEYYKDTQQVLDYDAKRFTRGAGYIVHNTQLYYIRRLLKNRRSARILDVPVGTARISRSLSANEIVGLDISLPMLKYTKQFSSPQTLTLGSAFQLPFKGNSFDLIISLRFIRHLDVQDRKHIYKEYARVLDKNGILVFDAIPKLQEFDYKGRRQYSGRIYDVCYTDTKELVMELEAHFDRISILPVLHFAEYFQRLRNHIRPRRALPVFDRAFARVDPHLRTHTSSSLEWVVVCEK